MSKENYVRNPDLNRKIDYKANALMQLRDIYYVIPFNAFMAVKRIDENGKKVYSGLCNFMDDCVTFIDNMYVDDGYVAKNCILLKSIEELDKHAFQKDQSIDLPDLKWQNGAYCTHSGTGEGEYDADKHIARIRLLHTGVFEDRNFTKLPSDPAHTDDFDMGDWPEMDDRDDYLLDD